MASGRGLGAMHWGMGALDRDGTIWGVCAGVGAVRGWSRGMCATSVGGVCELVTRGGRDGFRVDGRMGRVWAWSAVAGRVESVLVKSDRTVRRGQWCAGLC